MSNKVLTVPNVLSFIRLLLVPVFVYAYYYVNEYMSLLVFVIAGITDVVDGYIARKYNLITNIGKVLDPLADKAMRLVTLGVLAFSGVLPTAIFYTLLAIDVVLILGSAILYKKNYVVKSNFYGKLGAFITTLGLILSFFSKYVSPAHIVVIIIGIVIVLISVVSYDYDLYKNITNSFKRK